MDKNMHNIVFHSGGNLFEAVRTSLMEEIKDDIASGRIDSSARIYHEWLVFCDAEIKKNSGRALVNMTGLLLCHFFFLAMGFMHSSWLMVIFSSLLLVLLFISRKHYVSRAFRIGRALHVTRDALKHPVDPIRIEEGDDPYLVRYLQAQDSVSAAQHDGVSLYRRSIANTYSPHE